MWASQVWVNFSCPDELLSHEVMTVFDDGT